MGGATRGGRAELWTISSTPRSARTIARRTPAGPPSPSSARRVLRPPSQHVPTAERLSLSLVGRPAFEPGPTQRPDEPPCSQHTAPTVCERHQSWLYAARAALGLRHNPLPDLAPAPHLEVGATSSNIISAWCMVAPSKSSCNIMIATGCIVMQRSWTISQRATSVLAQRPVPLPVDSTAAIWNSDGKHRNPSVLRVCYAR